MVMDFAAQNPLRNVLFIKQIRLFDYSLRSESEEPNLTQRIFHVEQNLS